MPPARAPCTAITRPVHKRAFVWRASRACANLCGNGAVKQVSRAPDKFPRCAIRASTRARVGPDLTTLRLAKGGREGGGRGEQRLVSGEFFPVLDNLQVSNCRKSRRDAGETIIARVARKFGGPHFPAARICYVIRFSAAINVTTRALPLSTPSPHCDPPRHAINPERGNINASENALVIRFSRIKSVLSCLLSLLSPSPSSPFRHGARARRPRGASFARFARGCFTGASMADG